MVIMVAVSGQRGWVVVRELSEMKTCNRLWMEVTRQVVMHDEGASWMSYVHLQRYQDDRLTLACIGKIHVS